MSASFSMDDDRVASITYNLSKMWYAYDFYSHKMLPIDNTTGKDSLIILLKFKNYMDEYKTYLKSMNPDNGWGSYDNLYGIIEKMIDVALLNPKKKWTVSR